MRRAEVRKPKAEIREKSERQKQKSEPRRGPRLSQPRFGFQTSDFFRASIFGLRNCSSAEPHIRRLPGVEIRGPADLAAAASRLRRRIGGGDIVVTKGANGMTLFAGDGEGVDVPTVAREVFDVQGAGDTTVAALALSLRAGARLHEAAVIANAAAGVVVGKVGTATASAREVREWLPRAIAAAQERV